MEDETDGLNESDDLRGPWILALGTLAIGGVAVAVEAYRALKNRRRGDDFSGEE